MGEAGGINLHGFVHNNPNYFVDTDGRAAWGWVARGGWAIGTAIGSSYLFKKYVSPHIDQVVEDIYLWDPYAGAVAEVSGDALEVVNAAKNLPGKLGGKVVCGVWKNAKSIPSEVKNFLSRRAAFRQAKRDAGIPTSQTHITHRSGVKSDKLDTKRTGTEFEFDGGKQIQEHPKGHKFSDGSLYEKPHFNNHPVTGIHYEYDRR